MARAPFGSETNHHDKKGHQNTAFSLRKWSVDQSRFLEKLYTLFADILVKMDPILQKIGYENAEKPVRFIEKGAKGLLFDCRMCGQCILSSTGMSCPMNCPKNLRNGPCGGVRMNGHCEVSPDMPCVWVQAWKGSQQMVNSKAIETVQPPLKNTLKNTSAWLRTTRETVEEKQAAASSGDQ